MRRTAWLGVVGVALAVGMGAPAARAQSSDPALAEALFREGRDLMSHKRYDEACPKLAESMKLDPAGGTHLALAMCHEGQGKTATAWAEFSAVAAEARRDGRSERETYARQRVRALEPTLSRLSVTLAGARNTPAVEVHLDGTPLERAAMGTPQPVDPGPHVVEASAPGRIPWKTVVTVAGGGAKAEVAIPALEAAEPSRGGAATTPAPTPGNPAPGVAVGGDAGQPGSSMRTWGWVALGAGAVALGVGSYFGVAALSKNGDAKSACPDASRCFDTSAVQDNQDARTDARIADFTLGAGVVAAAVGAYLVIAAPRGTATRDVGMRVVPILAPGAAGASLNGSF